jgi:ABC-2 type transport system permease protein
MLPTRLSSQQTGELAQTAQESKNLQGEAVAAAVRVSGWRVALALAWREMVRFARQPNRIVGAVGTPLLFWLLLGTGLAGTFRVGQGAWTQDYRAFFFPGSLMLMVLFTTVFSAISIIEDRREGFLQGVLVAPVPQWSMVLGKVAGGTAVALAQAAVFLVLGLSVGWTPRLLGTAALVGLLLATSLGLTSLGFYFAWKTDSVQGFHAVMNLVLMPLWLLSGGLFPAPRELGAGGWGPTALGLAMRLNPLSYAVGGMRRLLWPQATYGEVWVPQLAGAWVVTLGAAAVFFALAVGSTRQRRGDWS